MVPTLSPCGLCATITSVQITSVQIRYVQSELFQNAELFDVLHTHRNVSSFHYIVNEVWVSII